MNIFWKEPKWHTDISRPSCLYKPKAKLETLSLLSEEHIHTLNI